MLIVGSLLLGFASSGASIGLIAGPYLQISAKPEHVVVSLIRRENQRFSLGGVKFSALPSVKMVNSGLVIDKFEVETGKATWFRYEVSGAGKTAKFVGKTLVAPKTPRIMLFGDSGRGLPGQKILAKQMAKYDPDLVVHVGDIVYPNGREGEYLKFHFPAYAPMLARTISVAAPGNHDTAYRDLKRYPDGLAYYKIWNFPTAKPAFAKGQGNFSFRFGNSFWVILDSNPYNGWSGKAAQDWLKTELKKGADAKFRFVAFHHPPLHSSKKKGAEVHMKAIVPILNAAKVTGVFCGHVHNYQRTKAVAGKPVYFVTGAGGAELYDQMLADQPTKWKPFTAVYKSGYSFTTLELGSQSATVRQIDSKGKVLDQIDLR